MEGTLLSWLIGIPLLTGVALLLVPGASAAVLRILALVGAVATFVISFIAWQRFDPSSAAMQLEEQRVWIEAIGASYHVGIDGLSLVLVMLTTVLTPLALLGTAASIKERSREFLAFMLLLEAAMIGVFVALDLLLFYIFWEAMLIPMALLIGIWGGPRRIYAAVKFFLYTMAGSVLMLVAILYMVWIGRGELGHVTFDLIELQSLVFTPGLERWLFLAFILAFAIKVPMFPFHTWLPDAHVEAPTAGSVILAGVLLKMGTYGMLRFCLPLFPGAATALAPVLIWLALVGIIYGALMAMAQDDLKKLVAYSSVSHMGWIVLGLFALNSTGFEGGLLQMVNHGVNTGALFLLVGMVYDRAHSRMIADFGGVARTMPVFATMAMIFTLASIGLPGTNGFVGEFSILVGAFKARWLYAVIAGFGIILGAVYMLSMYKRVFFGKVSELTSGLRDIGAREIAALVPLVALVFWLGVAPNSWLDPARASLRALALDMADKRMVQEALTPEQVVTRVQGGPGERAVRTGDTTGEVGDAMAILTGGEAVR
jgi:NADH-quinone oxidoreductase subunit M